jgi:hypothetical protein
MATINYSLSVAKSTKKALSEDRAFYIKKQSNQSNESV